VRLGRKECVRNATYWDRRQCAAGKRAEGQVTEIQCAVAEAVEPAVRGLDQLGVNGKLHKELIGKEGWA
jgi:hypothetical protein